MSGARGLGPCPVCQSTLTTVYTRKSRHSTLTRQPGYAYCQQCKRIFPHDVAFPSNTGSVP